MKKSDAMSDDLESGFLLRIRTWRDALPVLSIVDALRPASSVVAWLLAASPVLLATFCSSLFRRYFGTWESWDVAQESAASSATTISIGNAFGLLEIFGPTFRFYTAGGQASSGIILVALQAGLVFLWAVPAGFVMRQSALAISGRIAMGTRECLWFSVKRVPAMINSVIIPLFVVAVLFVVCYLAVESSRIPIVGWWLSGALQLLSLPLLIAGGVIGAGALVAIPLAWAAVAIEEDGSSFSAVSRGYEYLLRRPLQLSLLVLLCSGTMMVLYTLASWVTLFLRAVLSRVELLSSAEAFPRAYQIVMAYFPKIVVLVAFWALVAWVYLMLRRSANGQEIEDVWEPKAEKPEPLPTLEV